MTTPAYNILRYSYCSSTTRFRRDRMFLGRVLGFTTRAIYIYIYNAILYYYACWTWVYGFPATTPKTGVCVQCTGNDRDTNVPKPGDYIERIFGQR